MNNYQQTTLASLSLVRNLTERLGGGTKKSFGQHFLINQKTLLRFINLLNITKEDTVIEIGAGIGVLSYTLCQRAKKVYLIEIDRDKEPALKKVLENYDNYEILWEDATQINYSHYFSDLENIYVIGSLPYNTGKKIIYHFFNSKLNWKKAAFILQKEVAEHYTSKVPNAHFLSIFASIYSQAHLEFFINRKNFYPIPKVDSAAVSFINNKKKEREYENLSKFIKLGFSAPRKTILNNLKPLGFDATKLQDLGINAKSRPSEVTLEEWEKLYQSFMDKRK